MSKIDKTKVTAGHYRSSTRERMAFDEEPGGPRWRADDEALAERARIVAWLRGAPYGIAERRASAIADAIERGDHLRPTTDGEGG